MSNEGVEILQGIVADAEREAAALIADAERAIAERETSTKERIQEIVDNAEKRAANAERSIMVEADSAAAAETRKNGLKLRDDIIKASTSRIRSQLASLIDTDGYAKILAGWIAEAAIGLGSPQAIVNCSEAERPMLQSAVASAAEKVKQLTGADIGFSLSEEPPLATQGIVLTSADGRTIFDNRVATRLERYRSEIRMLVFKELFAE